MCFTIHQADAVIAASVYTNTQPVDLCRALSACQSRVTEHFGAAWVQATRASPGRQKILEKYGFSLDHMFLFVFSFIAKCSHFGGVLLNPWIFCYPTPKQLSVEK